MLTIADRVFPLHSFTRKDKQRRTRMCTLYFQERPGNIYHHRITITIVTAIDGVEVTKLTQLCQFILWFSLILLTLKCTSIYLSQYRNSLDIKKLRQSSVTPFTLFTLWCLKKQEAAMQLLISGALVFLLGHAPTCAQEQQMGR